MVKIVATSAFVLPSLTVPKASDYTLLNLINGPGIVLNGFYIVGQFDGAVTGERITSLGYTDADANRFISITKITGLNADNIGDIFTGTKAQKGLSKIMSGADRLNLSQENDVAKGFGGDDKIQGRGGNDKLYGNSGDDTLTGGNGNDRLYGGAGADRFVFDGKDGSDRIQDFKHGVDTIQLRAADSLADLDISQHGKNVVIAFEQTEITLRNQHVEDFTAADFLF